MDEQQTTSSAPSTTTPATAASSPSISEPPQQPPVQSQPLQQQLPQSSTPVTSSSSSSNPNPNPIPKPLSATTPLTPQQPPQPLATPSLLRPTSATAGTPSLSRPWQQQQFSHFSSSSSVSSSTSPSISGPQRGGIAVSVAAAHPNPSSPLPSPSQPTSFSGSFGQHFGSASNSNAAQARQPMQGMQGMGMVGSLGSSSQLRPGGISAHHQQRPVQTPLRPTLSPNSQSTATQRPVRPPLVPQSSQSSPSNATQNFQGHGYIRMPAVGSGSPAPSTSQSIQAHNQPWLSPGSQGKPPLPPSSYRPQTTSPSLQQRSHIQHHPSPAVPQQQHVPTSQLQHPQSPHQQQEHYGQQFSQSRVQPSLPHQQQIPRTQASASQKPSSLAIVQPNTVQPGMQSRMGNAESDESGGHILSKRSIHELITQIDPSERLDPEVEDILVDIAEDFVDSITTFGCQLAKHRKSDTLEAKDILVHLERNWNMTLPGFGGDEIKTYKKPLTTEIHKERLTVIKKSISASEAPNARNIFGQATANAKGNLGKMPTNFLGSPNLKIREVT
ncbi:hypothetical protein SLE2022_124040 [Rubroshorea leprosula]